MLQKIENNTNDNHVENSVLGAGGDERQPRVKPGRTLYAPLCGLGLTLTVTRTCWGVKQGYDMTGYVFYNVTRATED